jgi:uncharacterized protein
MPYSLVLAGIFAGLAAAVLYAAFILPTQWVKVERVRHPLGLNKKAVQISDVHVERLRVSPQRLARWILEQRPDYIFLTGDYTQKLRHLGKVDSYLTAISETGVPAYAVLGNHDHRLGGSLSAMLELFRRRGIPVLRNESIPLDGFHLVGIDDLTSRKSDPAAAFRGIPPRSEAPVIVITHDPNVTLEIKRPYHYLMSGHFHGGQFRIPFLFRLIKRKGPLPMRGIYQGLHKDGNGTFYISKGLGQAGVNLRFLIRSELTVHEW